MAEDAVAPLLSRQIAFLLDDLVTVPGTSFGIGLDAVIGLVPGIGDVLGAGLSSIILRDAVRCRVPLHVLARMCGNLILDAGLGLVPAVGDAADVAHRANRKNLRLLEQTLAAGKQIDTDTRGYLLRAGLLVVGCLLVVLGLAAVGIWLLVLGLRAVF